MSAWAIVLEDEREWALAIEAALKKVGIECDKTEDPSEAERWLRDGKYKLFVADLNLEDSPPTSALDLLNSLEKDRPDVLPIVVTALSEEFEKKLKKSSSDPVTQTLIRIAKRVGENWWISKKDLVGNERDKELANGLPKLAAYFETKNLPAELFKRAYHFKSESAQFEYRVTKTKIKKDTATKKKGEYRLTAVGAWRGVHFKHEAETKVNAMLFIIDKTLRREWVSTEEIMNVANTSGSVNPFDFQPTSTTTNHYQTAKNYNRLSDLFDRDDPLIKGEFFIDNGSRGKLYAARILETWPPKETA